jgi:starch synthase
MRILFVTSEAVPYCKTGGLADVCGALPPALARLGHDVRVVLPRYRQIERRTLRFSPTPLAVPTGEGELWCAVGEPWPSSSSSQARFFFIEHDRLFDREGLYGPPGGEGYADNCLRFTLLSRGALQLCKAWNWVPDVIHCHDWQAGLVPLYLRAVESRAPLGQIATVFTIHNLAYQGHFAAEELPVTGLGWDHYDWRSLEYHGGINLLKAGITCASLVSTVSPTYAEEIQTSAEGCGLDGALRYRADRLRGILNGIDHTRWDPRRDILLPARYDQTDLSGKARCKSELQQRAGLPLRPDALVAGFIGRLVEQKGVDLIADAAPALAAEGVQLVLLGTGTPELERRIARLTKTNPAVAAWTEFSEPKAHLIQAGSDVLLMPSRFEPCGLNQLHALLYGTLPVVANVGGLRDSVIDGQQDGRSADEATGFKLSQLTAESLIAAVLRVVRLRQQQPGQYAAMMQRAMSWPPSWEDKAADYLDLYQEARRLAIRDAIKQG